MDRAFGNHEEEHVITREREQITVSEIDKSSNAVNERVSDRQKPDEAP